MQRSAKVNGILLHVGDQRGIPSSWTAFYLQMIYKQKINAAECWLHDVYMVCNTTFAVSFSNPKRGKNLFFLFRLIAFKHARQVPSNQCKEMPILFYSWNIFLSTKINAKTKISNFSSRTVRFTIVSRKSYAYQFPNWYLFSFSFLDFDKKCKKCSHMRHQFSH